MTATVASGLRVTARPAPFDLDAVALYASAGNGERWYWCDPASDLVQVGLGSAMAITAEGSDRFAQISAALRALPVAGSGRTGEPEPVLVGGFAFDDRVAAVRRPPWPAWPAARLVLPTLTYLRRGDEAWWLVAGEGGDAGDAVGDERVRAAVAAARAGWRPRIGPLAHGVADPAVDDAHEALVAAALDELARGQVAKVVLARCLDIEAAVDEATLVHRLSRRHGDCVTFAVGMGDHAFVGATPECLVSLTGDEVRTAAVAGTVRRGATPAEDRRLADWLAADDKERREHMLVLDDIATALRGVGVELTAQQATGVLTLHSCHHLRTPVQGQRRDATTTVMDLAGALHPTPAVAGTPTAAALDWIRDHEHMDRGWYAAPVGWTDLAGQGELRVALRSALLGPERTHLFAGGGIVVGSDPRRELLETAVKLRAVLSPLIDR